MKKDTQAATDVEIELKAYPVISICRADLYGRFDSVDVQLFTYPDMLRLARLMHDAYRARHFWNDLERFAQTILDEKKSPNFKEAA